MRKNKKSVLEQAAPIYVGAIGLLYAGFLIYWYHTSKIGNHVDWPVWITLAFILLVLPMLFILNQRWENSDSKSSIKNLSVTRRLLGVLLLILPFILMTLGDTTQEFQSYYTTHVHAIGDNRTPAEALFIIVNGGSIMLGVFLIFLGRGRLFSSISMLKLGAAAIITAAPMIALFFYVFARYYKF